MIKNTEDECWLWNVIGSSVPLDSQTLVGLDTAFKYIKKIDISTREQYYKVSEMDPLDYRKHYA